MNLNIYTIFDQASETYMRPFFSHADGQAKRSFSDVANDPDHEIGKHPKDYSLWHIGIFDDNKAEIIPQQKKCLMTALEAQAQNKPSDLFQRNLVNGNA